MQFENVIAYHSKYDIGLCDIYDKAGYPFN